MIQFAVLFEKGDNGTIWCSVPALPGCTSYGNDLEHARKMITEAIELHLSVLKSEGMKMPESDSFVEWVTINEG